MRDVKTTFRRDAIDYLKSTGAGGLAVIVALCVYMVPSGSMLEYLKMMHGYFRLYRDPSQSYCVVLGRFHPTTPLHDLYLQLGKAREDFLNVNVLGYLAPFAVVSTLFMFRRSLALLGVATLAFAFGLYSVTASNCQWIHYYNMTESGLFFFLVAGLDSMQPSLLTASKALRGAIGACFSPPSSSRSGHASPGSTSAMAPARSRTSMSSPFPASSA